jgi:zinc protease
LKDRAVECIEAEFKNIETTVTADEVQTVREYLLQTHQHNLAENQYFLDDIETLVLADADFQTDFEATLNSITVDDIQAFFRDLNRNNNAFTVMLSPETAEK